MARLGCRTGNEAREWLIGRLMHDSITNHTA
jgi:hypothetical protein